MKWKFKKGDLVYMGEGYVSSVACFGVVDLYGIVMRTEVLPYNGSMVAVANIQWAGKDRGSLVYSDQQEWMDIIIKAAA